MFGRRQKKKHVLLIDNLDQFRDITKTVLEGGEYEVTAVANINDATRALAKKIPELIICEAELSGMGGIGFYHRLKKNRDTRNIPFLFFTAYDSQKIIPELRPGDSLISKPVPWKELVKKIDMFLEKRARAAAAKTHKAKATAKTAPKATTAKHSRVMTAPLTVRPLEKPAKSRRVKSEKSQSKKIAKKSTTPAGASRLKKGDAVTTQERQQPAMPKDLHLKASSDKARKQRRKSPLSNFSPQHLAQYLRRFAEYYSTPSSRFDAKEVRSSTSKLSKKNKEYQSEPMQFATNEIPIIGLRDQLIKPDRVRKPQTLFELEEDDDILLDIEVEDVELEEESQKIAGIQFRGDSEDDEILVELDEDLDEVEFKAAVELDEDLDEAELKASLQYRSSGDQPDSDHAPSVAPPVTNPRAIACLKDCVNEYQCSDEMAFAYLNNKTGEFATTLAPLTSEKYSELSHALFSMAGLCLQMFSREFTADYLAIHSAGKEIFIINDEKNATYLTAIPAQAKPK